MPNLIAIVGRPNVGKSALFNRIVGRRIAIVHDQPGVTRDRVTAEAEWCGRPFTLVDTGGIGLLRGEKANDAIARATMEQVTLAIEAANVILLVVNVQEGVVPLDRETAERLRRSGKPVLVAANKVDTSRTERDADEFAELGFEKIFPVSAIHGNGINELMDAAVVLLPGVSSQQSIVSSKTSETNVPAADHELLTIDSSVLKLAIIGRPNAGKSSIINALTKSERVIVTPVPGTTRDSIDVPFEIETDGVRQKYVLIDTAGMRKTRRVDNSIEFFSVQRAEDSIARCDIAILVLDAEMGVTEQDKKIADVIIENRKACIIAVNKWDLFDEKVRRAREKEIARRDKKQRQEGRGKEASTLAGFGAWVQGKLFFLDYAPVIFVSAKSGFHLGRLLEAVRFVAAQLRQKIPTALLNRTLHDAVERRQPVSHQGHRLKFFYATQVRQAPPTFLLFVNRDELFSNPYKKYLADQTRRAFGYEGCPIVFVPKCRPRTVEPIRKFTTSRRGKRPAAHLKNPRRQQIKRHPKRKYP